MGQVLLPPDVLLGVVEEEREVVVPGEEDDMVKVCTVFTNQDMIVLFLYSSPPGTLFSPDPKAMSPGDSRLSTCWKQSASSVLGHCRPEEFFRSEQKSESSSVILRSRAPQALEIPEIQVRAELRLE